VLITFPIVVYRVFGAGGLSLQSYLLNILNNYFVDYTSCL